MSTVFLASVIGWYLVIVSLLLFFKNEYVRAVASDVMAHREVFFLFAIMTLIIGLLLVMSHNTWVMGWPVIITLFGWLVLISGITRLFFPECASRLSRPFLNHPISMKITAIVLLLLGVYLLFHVYYFNF
jgi:uncharacterized membrane protein HdeD (DUF308 family)